jgi:hypothetical protein
VVADGDGDGNTHEDEEQDSDIFFDADEGAVFSDHPSLHTASESD